MPPLVNSFISGSELVAFRVRTALRARVETTLVESQRGGTAFGGRRPVAVAAGNPFGEHIYLKLV